MKRKTKLLPPAYLKVFLVLMIGLHFIFPIMQLVHSPYRYIGILFIGFGIWLNIWADGLFKRNETTVKPFEKPSALIQKGPFLISRHPMYLGMVAALLGVAIVLGSLVVFIAPIVFFIIIEVNFISEEERAMEENFGQEYADYRHRVRRWL
jgi:protein-S-isoprenylcysteine O-methyltransferase Ste14